jgi:putative transcription antitermination factor YqgF
MDGTTGKQSLNMHRFVERLRSAIPAEVSLRDERLSSFAAEQLLIERGRHWLTSKKLIGSLRS